MKHKRKIPELKARDFNGKLYQKIRHMKGQPRQHIRQLLRSFIPLEEEENTDDGNDNLPI
ncbi:hypothetical protein [Olivibacter sp. XZL3]|uniref:hypothetical protein n=1 Tax=Olivibacter sp. XZL3 TaxID=1735116 RepID=UPI001064A80E|nr:hypothetical protein [Olivibacter sp. XZL3]